MDLRAIIQQAKEVACDSTCIDSGCRHYEECQAGLTSIRWKELEKQIPAAIKKFLRALHAQGPSAEMVEEGLQAPPSPRQIWQAMLASLIAALEQER